MSPSRPQNHPWPAATPAPVPSSSTSSVDSSSVRRRSPKRRRIHEIIPLHADASTSGLASRATADQAEIQQALHDCQVNSGNDVFSCFPTADTVIPQDDWAAFVWNSRRPEITQTNLVNIYLFRADSRRQVLSFLDQPNPTNQAGIVTAQVNDEWWGTDGANWNGKNVSFPFFWVITRNDVPVDNGNAIAQPIFTAVQTTFASSIIASRSSASSEAAATSAVLASLSSLASVAATHSSGANPASTSGSGSGSVQAASSDSGFPHWAIAVIVVLGFFAICATGILIFLIIRRIRRRNSDLDSNRNSMGSNSPMMANAAQQQSPLLGGGAILPIAAQHQSHHQHSESMAGTSGVGPRDAPSVVMHDGASTISRAGSAGDSGPFSGADAAIMADAFRKMLRKPDFAGRPVEEGESPENPETKEDMLNRELAEEGRDIRSVASSRGVKVETLSDGEDTVQNHGDRDRD
ncbi:hypothetical protein BDQ12DRAFT_87246 [Crucibulum laeve]|uniref:Uncharacterized protein n=1 Tax=Crucibulum laeve TaxID=68775 RepID=A0A5C3M591_9AGAR|nr:hypothetical protein BDQ12DRAFT_87246 [Crucibulum laeve]